MFSRTRGEASPLRGRRGVPTSNQAVILIMTVQRSDESWDPWVFMLGQGGISPLCVFSPCHGAEHFPAAQQPQDQVLSTQSYTSRAEGSREECGYFCLPPRGQSHSYVQALNISSYRSPFPGVYWRASLGYPTGAPIQYIQNQINHIYSSQRRSHLLFQNVPCQPVPSSTSQCTQAQNFVHRSAIK